MKLSEILKDWPKKKEFSMSDVFKEIDSLKDGLNTALDACDHEIDREALAKAMNESQFKSMNIDEQVNYFISTMPTWLKPTERK